MSELPNKTDRWLSLVQYVALGLMVYHDISPKFFDRILDVAEDYLIWNGVPGVHPPRPGGTRGFDGVIDLVKDLEMKNAITKQGISMETRGDHSTSPFAKNELASLDQRLARQMDQAIQGDEGAIKSVLSLLEVKSSLLGLVAPGLDEEE